MRTIDFTGTVIHGTIRPQDLLPTFLDILFEYHPEAYSEIANALKEEFGNWEERPDDDSIWNSEFIADVLYEDIWDAMNEIAPDGYYFGSHPGDGADYGFWKEEEI